MSRSDPLRVDDMVMAATEIEDIVARGRTAFDADVTLRRATERCLEIMGEAAKAVSAELRAAHPEVPWVDMAKIRDRLSHHYHRVDPAQLWIIANVDVPSALADLRHLDIHD